MQTIPIIYFPGLCADALTFYRDTLRAEVLFQLTAQPGGEPQFLPPGSPGKIIRAGLRIGESIVYMSEGHHPGKPEFAGFSLSLHVADAHEAARVLRALAEGGDIRVPLRATTWADCFGAVTDRHGVHWTIEAGTRQIAA